MMRTFLIRGLLVGLVAAALAFGVARIIGEPAVDKAIDFEAKTDQAAGMDSGPEIVSRAVQSTVGLLTGVVVFGTAVGGMYAIAYGLAYGRFGRFSARATAALLAAAGFVTVTLVPFLKYPANPPSVGNADTINARTLDYFVMIAASVMLAIAARQVGRALLPRFGGWNATILAVGAYVVSILVVYAVLPVVDEVPDDFPASLLWQFRIASLTTNLVLWTTLGLLFGYLTERSQIRGSRRNAVPAGIS
jgi:predicted cobalt transporter CbtA